MNETNISTNSLKAWLLASRPKTLTGAAVPVIIGLALACKDLCWHIDLQPAVLCLLFALIMQIDANFVNDYFDYRRGNDNEETRLGPLRACSQGWITPKAMVWGIIVTTLVGCLTGLPLVFYGGWEMILVGVACVVFCILYTTTLSYIGMGDVLVLVFFGLVPVCFTHYLQTHEWSWQALVLAAGCGLAIDNLLIVNNYRDIDNDRRDGKRTLIVMVGKEWGEQLYGVLGSLAAIAVIAVCNISAVSMACMFVYYFFHINALQQMKTLTGRRLNKVLGITARNIMIYGVMTAIAVLSN